MKVNGDKSSRGQHQRTAKLLSIVIPVFNEEKVVGHLAESLMNALESLEYPFEIIMVDDGSVDRTLEYLLAWQKQESRLVIVKLSRNWGHQNAYNAGLDIAQGNAIVFMDGDLEDPPAVIPELIAAWEQGYDSVYAVKATRYQGYVRRKLTNTYYWLVKKTNRYGIEPQAGMFSLVDEKVATVLRQMKESNKSYPNLRSLAGFKQKGISYARDARAHGKPKQSLGRLISDGLNSIFSNTYLPIRVFSVVGFSFTLFFILIGVIVLVVRITGFEFWIFQDIPGTQMILLLILAFGSLQLTFLGVLGEYIARIYEESKGRPYYVIEEIHRADSGE